MILQFRHRGKAPTLDEVRALFGLQPDEVDADFGVVATDPADGLYVIRVDERAAAKLRVALAARPDDPAEGLFADPPIEPFHP